MSFRDHSLNPAANTTLGDGTYIGPNMLRNMVRPALQQIAAEGKELADELQERINLAKGDRGDAGFTTIEGANIFQPETFGALGDGSTYDQPAFDLLNAAIALAGGGVVLLRPGATYIVGRQTSGGAEYRTGVAALSLVGLASATILGNGATLKFKNGLLFGSFESNGSASTVINTTTSKRADMGFLLKASNVAKLRVNNLNFDCNSTNAVIGGEWGDTGRQCSSYGFFVESCDDVEFNGYRVINSALDGGCYAYYGLTTSSDKKPATFRHGVIKASGRNNFSLIGANQATFENCNHSEPGQAPNTAFGNIGSSPRSCFDAEAEGAIVRNLVVRECNFSTVPGSTATAFVADSGDSANILVENSTLTGTYWTSKPRTVFRGCKLNGVAGKLLGAQASPDDNTLFDRCKITDESTTGVGNMLDTSVPSAAGVRFRNTEIRTTRLTVNLQTAVIENVTILMERNTDTLGNTASAMSLHGATGRGLNIIENIDPAKLPANGYSILAESSGTYAQIDDAKITSPNNKLFWHSATAGGAGRLYYGAYPYTPAAIAAGASVTLNAEVLRAAPGDYVDWSYGAALNGLIVAVVAVGNGASITLYNPTASPITAAAGTFYLQVRKRPA